MVDGLSNLCGLFPFLREPTPDDKREYDEKYITTTFEQQKYDKADMVVIGVPGSKDFTEFETKRISMVEKNNPGYKPSREYFEYPLWAIYGSVVVEGSIHKGNIKDLREQTKVVWAYRKPYILTGDNCYAVVV